MLEPVAFIVLLLAAPPLTGWLGYSSARSGERFSYVRVVTLVWLALGTLLFTLPLISAEPSSDVATATKASAIAQLFGVTLLASLLAFLLPALVGYGLIHRHTRTRAVVFLIPFGVLNAVLYPPILILLASRLFT